MNEQAIQDAYNLFVSNGYKKSLNEFKTLIASNPQALQDSYNLFVSNGYRKPIDDYKSLMGIGAAAPVKKKDTTELPSEDGSLVSPTSVDESSFAGTLSQVGQKAQGMPRAPQLPSKPIKRVDETPKETPYFTGAIGEALSLMDSPMTPYGNLGIGDFIDDIGRSVDAGLKTGSTATPSNILMTKGSKANPEQIKKFVAAVSDYNRMGSSDEMTKFSRTLEEEGNGVYAVLKGLAQNPSVLPEIMISSFAGLVNPSSAAAAGTVAGGFATTGAVAGAGVPGAVAGAITSVPWAMAAAATTLETGLTFAELLQEKLKERGLEFTEENVKTILEDQKTLNSIRAKSVARGATIGIIDGFTGRLAGKVGAKLAKGTAASRVKAGLTSGGIEMAGGSTGEAAGRLVAGQEMDVAEIMLEGIAEGPMAIADVTAEVLRKPIYEVNGERRNEADVEFLIENSDPDELSKMNIKIKNDVKGYEKKIQDVIVDNQLKKEIKQANPDADDTTIDELFILEKELQKFEGNKTQSGKDRAAQIRSQIKNIQENQPQQEVESPEAAQKRTDRISEIESALAQKDNGKGTVTIGEGLFERTELEAELETLKTEQDAIQEQAAGQVPVQSGTGVSQEVAQGVPQAEPQVTAEEGVQEEVEVVDRDSGERFKAILKPIKDIFNSVKESKFSSLKNVTFEQLVNNWDNYKNIDNDNIRTIKNFVENPSNTAIVIDENNNVSDGNHRLIASMIRNENSIYTVNKKDFPSAIGDLYLEIQPVVSSKTLTEQEQMARMEEMFAEQDIPDSPPIGEGTSVTNKPALDQVKAKLKDTTKISIVNSAQKILATLQSVLPNFDIVIHDNEDSYTAAMTSMNATPNSAGNFSYVKNPDGTYVGRIDINLNRANQRTVAHEVAHGIMLKAFGENPETFKTFKNRIASVLNKSTNKQLTDFSSQYAEIDSYEEYLAELTAALAQQEGKIDTTTFQKIAALINELVSKVTNGAFTPFQDTKDTKQAVEFFRNISQSIRKGEAIKPSDIDAIQEGLSVAIGSPTTIISKAQKPTSLTFPKTPLPLSFVTEADKIDIDALIKDIVDKNQKVWFWMADQLGRGNYYDEVIKGEHYLDAGPSFALDPENRSKGILWASGLPEKTLAKQINETDYIFFISGSPERAQLFNKRVLNLLEERINKTSNFNSFKDALNKFEKETVELKTMRDALDGVNSFEELSNSSKRKPFLLALGEVGSLKTTPAGSLKELLGSFNAFIDYNDLRDGFYKENGFTQNDIMLVGKPTGLGGKAPHSTYEFAINGEVIGVPDKKIDSWDIMPESLKEKYQGVIGGKESKTKPLQTKVIAAETGVVRGLEAQRKSKAQIIGRNANLSATAKFNLNLAEEMSKNKMSAADIRLITGWEKGLDGKWRYEIPDGKFKDLDIDDLKREIDTDGSVIRVAKMSDVFDAPELYQAYPDAKDLNVVFKDLPSRNYGSFNIFQNKITVNKDLYNNNRPEAELTMLHEIQHYAQNQELFETGSNQVYAPIMMKYVISDFKNKLDNQKRAYDRVKSMFPDNKEAIKEALDLYKFTKARYAKVKDLALQKQNKEVKKAIKDTSKITGIDIAVEDVFGKKAADAYNLYYRVAGEVEARNVEYRNKLTPEERKKTMLSETENIDRDDQIMFDNSELLFTEEVENLKEEFPVSKSQLNNDSKVAKLIKDARAQGFSENAIKTFLQGKGLTDAQINTAMGKETSAAGRVNVTEEMLPGYESLMKKINSLIKAKKTLKEVISALKNSATYINATDIQKEKLVRDVRKEFDEREKSAPTAARVTGQPKKKKVVVDEMAALKSQIKLEAKAAREAKQDLNSKRKALASAVREMASSGKITANKAKALINKISNLNLDSQTAVDRFVDYAGKVFADAEYANKLSTANTMRSQIRKLSKSKEKAANLRDLAAKFSKIDPSMVEDIDQYNSIAALIKDSIRGSTIRGTEVKFSNMIKESKAVEYINKTMKEQQKKLFDMRVAEVQSLLGVDASELTYEQLAEMLDSKEPMTKDNEKLVRSAINKAFDIYSSLIGESMKTGKDVFTGEDVEYTPNQKKVVKEFMDMDLGLLRPKQALEAVDALMNFLQNQSIAKMQSVVAKHNGIKNAEMLEKKGIKAKPISKYFSKRLGRLLIEQTANLNILFERMFGGFTRGGLVEEAIGVTDIKNGKSKAQSDANRVVQKYVDQFYKSTPNGQAFNTAFNNTERGMIAFMMRNVIGTEAEMQAEFNRRKDLIKESIEALSQGNETEVAKATVYKEVYDKILADSKTIDDVVRKANAVNVDAVKFWQNEWDSKYEELSDVALGVYNKILDKDINYNPDRYSKLSSDTGDVELSTEDMTFIFNSGNSPIYKRETGVLMAATRPESLPRNEKSGEPSRYIDLSFDSNNGNSYYDALVDINTAAPIRQVEAALNSSAFKRIVPEANDRKLLENRVKLYVNNIRKKNPFSDDEFSKAVKGLNRIAAIGVGQALGGVFQPIKQSIPIAVNTLINAGGLDMASVFSEAKQAFIDKSGYAIANRGIASQAQIDTLNKMIDEAANSKPEQAFRAIEKVNNWWLKNLLVRFDVAIARASWMTYYEQYLNKQGINTANIDYNTHEVNADAADYAQRQVDRQQNVSDADLSGELLASKDSTKQLIVKVLMPFASFRMNQSARVGADVSTLTNLTSTIEDKKIAARSLAGFAAEMVTFRALSVGSALLIAEAVKAVMGRDDDEEKDEKKKDSIIKGQLTNTVADVFSPVPLIDKAVQMGASKVLDATQDALEVDEEERLEIYSGNKQDFFQSLGSLGIAGARAYQLYEMATLSSGFAFKDSYGNVKYLTEEDREAIAMLIPIAIISNIGLTPSEVNSVVRSSLSDAKKAAKKDENASAAVKSMNKGDLKRYNPELYNQLYGPNSPNYETEQMMKQMREENEAMMKQMKDEMYR